MPKNETKHSPRLVTLDYLRGFFIVTIIIDHLSRFPSLFAILSGKALLWVTAAEGFVSISGLLVGYVRGYKNRNLPFGEVRTKLLKRAGVLYAWSLIGSIVYVAIIWNLQLEGGFPSTPMEEGHWAEFLFKLVTLQYTFTWVHFLTLYAVFMFFSPIAIWLLRKNKAWLVALISFGVLALGWFTKQEAMQWQFLFFMPSIAGFYLETNMARWYKLRRVTRIRIAAVIVGITIATITMSVILNFYGQHIQELANFVDNVLYAKDSISLLRAGTAFVWFTGYLIGFYFLRRVIKKLFAWVLIPMGTRSLSAYILHGVALCTISFFTVGGSNFWLNTLLGAVAIMIVWAIMKIPIVRRIVPV